MDDGDRGVLLAQGREAEVYLRADGTVLKLLREPTDGARARVRREATALGILAGAGHAAPTVLDEITVDGRPGLVLERIEGTDLLTRLGREPLSVFRAARVMGEVHAAMHGCVAPPALPDVRAALRQRIEQAPPLPDRLRAAALAVLDGLPAGDRLCHGDVHLGNMLGSLSAPVVIDWGDASRGDPTADVARTALLHRVGATPPGAPPLARVLAPLGRKLLRSGYLAAYRRRRPVDAGLLDRWSVVCAAARLNEDIPAEHPRILRILDARFGAGA